MMPTGISEAWWPSERVDPVHALRELADALKEQRLPDRAAAQWLVSGLERWLSGAEPDLQKALGVRARRGGRYETASKRGRQIARNRLVRDAMDGLGGGSVRSRAELLSGCLEGGAPAAHVHSAQLSEVLDALQRECEEGLSSRQIMRIVASHDDKP